MSFIILLVLISCNTPKVATPAAPEVDIQAIPREAVYSTKSTLPWVKETARVADCVIKKEAFLKDLGAFDKYTYTTRSSKEVEESFRKATLVNISSYQTKSPFSKTIATTYKTDHATVYFNTRKNPRAIASMVNTAIHEGSHLKGWSHGDNSSIGKENSVPYRAGKIAEKYVEECK